MPPRSSRRVRGFTLAEVLVVLAVLAVLASVAWPSYREQVARAQRAAARAVMLEGMQYVERQYASSNTYGSMTLPHRLKTAPPGVDATQAHYNVSVSASTTYAYTLTAVPLRSDPYCGTLTLTHTGARASAGSLTVDACWR